MIASRRDATRDGRAWPARDVEAEPRPAPVLDRPPTLSPWVRRALAGDLTARPRGPVAPFRIS